MIYTHTQYLASPSEAGHVLASCPWLCNIVSIGLVLSWQMLLRWWWWWLFSSSNEKQSAQTTCLSTDCDFFCFLDFSHCTLDANEIPSWGSKMKSGLMYPWPANGRLDENNLLTAHFFLMLQYESNVPRYDMEIKQWCYYKCISTWVHM